MNNKKSSEDLVVQILRLIGENPSREGLVDTPRRVIKMWKEIFRGYRGRPPRITYFTRKYPGSLIIDKGYYFSTCEHHMVSFFGNYYFGYIPDKLEMGASKIGRTVDYYAARLQTAENLCYQVIDRIEKVIKPQGSILIMSGRHLCKEMRGLKKYDSPFEAIEARGLLLKNHNGCKDEFLARIGARM
jgi:GTP cyclohydrolase I